jgi:hypothetical protein
MIESGSLGTPRAQQLRAAGHEMSTGSLSADDMLELCMEALLAGAPSPSLANYRVDIGPRTQRYLKIEDHDAETGILTVAVCVTGQRFPVKRYRIQLSITEQEN